MKKLFISCFFCLSSLLTIAGTQGGECSSSLSVTINGQTFNTNYITLKQGDSAEAYVTLWGGACVEWYLLTVIWLQNDDTVQVVNQANSGFKVKTAGTYKARFMGNGRNAVFMEENLTVNVINSDCPSPYRKFAPINVCKGQSPEIIITDSEPGVTYRFYKNSIQQGSDIIGDGSDKSIVIAPESLSVGSNYIRMKATNLTCPQEVASDANIIVNDIYPQSHFSIEGSIVNPGEPGTVTVFDIQKGVSYRLEKNGESIGNSQSGYGTKYFQVPVTHMSFHDDLYQVRATKNECSLLLDTSVIVRWKKIPSKDVEVTGIYNSENEQAEITVHSSEEGIEYNCFAKGDAIGSSLIGNGSDLTFLITKSKFSPDQPLEIEVRASSSDTTVALDETATLYTFTLGNKNSIEEKIEIYPQPAKEKISIRFPAQGNYELTLYDSYGKRINKLTTSNLLQSELNLSMLNTGIYFLEINDGSFTSYRKIIKQ